MFQLIRKIVILTLIVALTNSLKPSEAGVNDWAINTVGEIRDLTFTKNKIFYVSQLNAIGILDKYTGALEDRVIVGESEKLVGLGDMSMMVTTRYNQVISYFITATGIDQKATFAFKVGNRSVQWTSAFDEKDYFVTKSSFHHGKDIIREAETGQIFLRVVKADSQTGVIVFIVYKSINESSFCIQSYQNGFLKKYCIDNVSGELIQFEYYHQHLIVGFSNTTLLLTQNLELVSRFEQKLNQLVNGALVLLNRAYNIKERQFLQKRPVESFRKDVQIYLTQLSEGIAVYRQNLQLFFIPDQRTTKIVRAWFNFKTQMDYDLVIQFSDLQLVCYAISRGDAQISWKRQESLAFVEDVVFMKYNELDTLDNQYHRNLISHSYRGLTLAEKIGNVPRDLILRLKEEITDIQHLLFQSINYILEHVANIDGTSIRKFMMSPEQQIKYGLRKYIVVGTKYNTIIAIDSKTRQILWKVNRDNSNKFIKFVHLKRDYQSELAIIISHTPEQSSTYIEQISEKGEVKLLETYASTHQPYIYKLNDHKIAIKFADKIQKFELIKNDDLIEKDYYFYTQENNEINGWKAVGSTVIKIWNFKPSGSEQIIKIASAFRGEQRSHIPLFDREKVFFKNVDFTNLAVLTSFNRTDVALYIINGRTGKIHFNSFKNSISLNLPINLVYDQNNVLISYFNHKVKHFEIWTVEQYQERIQTSALNMISDYFNENGYKPQQSRQKTIFEQESFGCPVHIKQMYVSESKMSLVRRNLFIITRENKLYTINRDLVSTRRPKKDAKGFFANQKFPEHAYFLPYLPPSFLSYHLELSNLNKIEFNPTDMESTIFTFCYGTDIFLIRHAPDKAFDMITEDFNHVVLVVILIAATVAIVAFKRLMSAAKLKKPHIE